MDADIILFVPKIPYYQLSEVNDGRYQGNYCYGPDGSFQLTADMNHWKKEISDSLKAGKTIFLLLSDKEIFYLDTGKRTHSGTGKNTRTTITVEDSHCYTFLPFSIGTIHSAKGNEVLFTGNPSFKNFYNNFKSHMNYEVYIEDIPPTGTPIFTGKDKSKILGAIYKVGAGHLVALPNMSYNRNIFIDTKIDENGEEKKYWTNEALIFGKKLISNLIEIDEALRTTSNKTPPPAWVSDETFSTKKETKLRNDIKNKLETINKIKKDVETIEAELEKEIILKDLLYEQGKPLENAVMKAVQLLGYNAEHYDDGTLELDIVMTSSEGVRYIGECEGKDNKDIDINKYRQLVDSINADFHISPREEKAFGILFGNPQRLLEPNKRDLDFTKKCKSGANRDKIALVKTSDLFFIAKYLSENKDMPFQKACRKAIFDGIGKVVEFPKPKTHRKK